MVRRTHRPESPPTDTAIPGAVEFVLISRRGWVPATARSSWHPAAHGAKDHYLLMPLTSPNWRWHLPGARSAGALLRLGMGAAEEELGHAGGTGRGCGVSSWGLKAGQGALGEGDTPECPGVFPTRPPPRAGHRGAWQRTEGFGQTLFFVF